MRFLLPLLVLLAAPKDPDVPAPEELWQRLPPPRAGEWRDVYREEGQTLAEYKAAGPVRPTAARTVVYLQPCLTRPPSDPRILERIAEFLAAHFGRRVETLGPIALPAAAYDPENRQFDVPLVVPRLVRALPDDGLLLLAVTDRDLRLPKMSFAYGWGSFRHRVGILSLRRVDVGPDETERRRRVLSLAGHEAAHCLSLPHCVFYPCLMNGARTLAETDRRPILLCPVCRAKVCWNLGLDPARRSGGLVRALEGAGLSADAARARRIADVNHSDQ